MNALGDLLQTFRPVINGIHRSHVGEQRLGGADVARGLFAADVLFARAERQAQRGFAARIPGDADKPAGHLAFEFVARGKERRVRSAVTQRHAKALRAADGDVRAKFAWRLDERERQQIGRHREHRARGAGFFRKAGVIADGAESVRILHNRAEDPVGELKLFVAAGDDFNSEGLGARPDDLDVLRMAGFRNKKCVPGFIALEPMTHHHRFGAGGGFVEERGVGDVETGEIGNHRLKIQQRFETAL